MNLNQVTVPSADIERSVKFYETLGLKLIVKAPHYARFECPDGEATFSLHQTEKPEPGGAWIYFEVEQLDDYVNWLIKRGITMEAMPEDKPWLWREARLRDPDNNQLIIYHAGKNRKQPPWRIDSK